MTDPPKTRLLHYEATYLFDFQATVLAVRPGSQGEVSVALDQTAFYVESGGQPADHGSLAGRPVLALDKVDGVVWHHLGPVSLDVPHPACGGQVPGRVDAAPRLDAMRQHTGQHILSQAFLKAGGRATRGFHLGREESTIDLNGALPDPAVCEEASRTANECVLADRVIRIHQVTAEEAARLPLRRDPGADLDIVRVIEIDGYDWSACGGTHARRTGEVGPIQILGVEKAKSLWRVRFLAGDRSLRFWESANSVLQEASRAFSVHWRDLPNAAEARREEATRLGREVRRLRHERGEQKAELLFAQLPSNQEVRELRGRFDDLGSDELRAMVARFVCLGTATAIVLTVEGDRAHWLAACSENLPEAFVGWSAVEALRQAWTTLEGKGGGTRTFAQGTSRVPGNDWTPGP